MYILYKTYTAYVAICHTRLDMNLTSKMLGIAVKVKFYGFSIRGNVKRGIIQRQASILHRFTAGLNMC